MAALFQGCKNAHQNRLGFGTVFTAVAITVFSHDPNAFELPASPEAQRFRYWQKILDLEYRDEYGMVPLSKEQQDMLAKELEGEEKLTYTLKYARFSD